eukprot:1237598-Pleurochrysis_carterae.AAC.1
MRKVQTSCSLLRVELTVIRTLTDRMARVACRHRRFCASERIQNVFKGLVKLRLGVAAGAQAVAREFGIINEAQKCQSAVIARDHGHAILKCPETVPALRAASSLFTY